jgi:hypothetical protein
VLTLAAALTAGVVLAAGAVLAGCSGEDGSAGPTGPAGPAAPASGGEAAKPARKAFHPPTKFDGTSGVKLPSQASRGHINVGGDLIGRLPILLEGTDVYVAAVDSLQVVDGLTGRVKQTFTPKGKPVRTFAEIDRIPIVGGNPAAEPVPATIGGKRVVAVPFLVASAGSGTAKDTQRVEVIGVDVATGQLAATVEVDLGQWATPEEYGDPDVATLFGNGGPTVVLRVDRGTGSDIYSSHADSRGIDLATGKVTWTQADFSAAGIAGDVVVGRVTSNNGLPGNPRAVALGDGTTRWELPGFVRSIIRFVGGKWAFIDGYEMKNGVPADDHTKIVDAVTGEWNQTWRKDQGILRVRCYDGGDGNALCVDSADDGRWVVLLTAAAEWPWEIREDGDRTVPIVTAVYGGAIYGRAKESPVVLDLKTGADKETSPGVLPLAVNDYIAVADSGDGVSAFPAIG